jgi:hypothetical protein
MIGPPVGDVAGLAAKHRYPFDKALRIWYHRASWAVGPDRHLETDWNHRWFWGELLYLDSEMGASASRYRPDAKALFLLQGMLA